MSSTNDTTVAMTCIQYPACSCCTSRLAAEPPMSCPSMRQHVGQATTQVAGRSNVFVRYEQSPHMIRCT